MPACGAAGGWRCSWGAPKHATYPRPLPQSIHYRGTQGVCTRQHPLAPEWGEQGRWCASASASPAVANQGVERKPCPRGWRCTGYCVLLPRRPRLPWPAPLTPGRPPSSGCGCRGPPLLLPGALRASGQDLSSRRHLPISPSRLAGGPRPTGLEPKMATEAPQVAVVVVVLAESSKW